MFTATQTGQFGLGMQATSALMGVVGSFYAAKAQKSALQTQAELDRINAQIAESGAQSALLAGQAETGRITLKAGQVKGAQRAALAANGVDLSTGNAAETVATTDLMKEIDKNQAEVNAVRSAWGYRTQATNYLNDAAMKSSAAGSISPAGSAAMSLLGGAGQVASSWYSLNKSGAFKGTRFALE